MVEYSFDSRLFYKDFKLQAGTQNSVDFINDGSKAVGIIKRIKNEKLSKKNYTPE